MPTREHPDAGAADTAAPLPPLFDRKDRFIVRSHIGSLGLDSTLAVAARDEDEARSLAEQFWRNFYRRSGRSIEPFTVTAVQRRLAPAPDLTGGGPA